MIGCAGVTSDHTEDSHAQAPVAAVGVQHQDAAYELKWLEYADPLADANLALAKNDYTLLAFASRGLQFPGVDEADYDLETLTQACGVKVLKGTGDMLRPGENTDRRKKLRIYATQYNRKVFESCRRLLAGK